MKIRPNKLVKSHIPAAHGGPFSIKNPDDRILDFSSNVNPLGCHTGVKKFVRKQLDLISKYPVSILF